MKDLDCRDFVSRSSLEEIKAGRGCGPKSDHVMLKLDHLGADVLNERLPSILEIARKFANVDPVKSPFLFYRRVTIKWAVFQQTTTVKS